MGNKFEFIRGTVELYKEKMINDPELTNELLANDILLSLGYDKRRNLGVKWYRSNTSRQWEIYGPKEEPWFIFRVYGYKSIPKIDSDTGLMDRASKIGFHTIVISDGSELDIYNYNESALNLVSIIHLYDLSKPIEDDILSDDAVKLIDALSYSTYNPDALQFDLSKKLHSYVLGLLADPIKMSKLLKMENTENFVEALQKEYNRLAIEASDTIHESDAADKIKFLEEKVSSLANELKAMEERAIEAEGKAIKEDTDTDGVDSEYIESLKSQLEEQGKSLENIANDLANKEIQLSKLSNIEVELSQAREELDKSREELNKIREEADKSREELSQAKEEADKTREELSQIREELANSLAAKTDDTEDTGLDQDREKSYIKQIEQLAKDKSDLADKICELENTIQKLHEDMEQRGSEGLEAAKELLSAVEDNPDENRRYVAVVGDKLFNSDNLTSFVGEAIQELYTQVSFQLMPILFDGDIFPITDDPTSKDLLINNKTYRIDLSNLSEEHTLEKLSAIFKYFPSVVFIYKTIGTYREPILVEDESLDIEMDTDDIGQLETDEVEEVIDVDMESDDGQWEDEIDTDMGEYGSEPEVVQISVPVSSLGLIFWSNQEHLGLPEHLFIADKMYLLNQDNLGACVLSILEGLIASSDVMEDTIKTMKKIDFPTVSNFIVSSESNEGIRIPFTKYKLNIDNFGKSIPVIQALCSYLGFDADSTNITFHTTESEDISDFIVEEIDMSDVDEPDTDLIELLASTDRVHCIISGSILDLMIMNKEQCDIQASMVTKCLAFKTNYYSAAMYNMEDIESIVTEILVNSESPLDMVLMSLGNVIGTSYSFISQNESDVDPEHYSIEINGDILYVSDMEPWQLLYSLIRLHVLCANNKTVGIRVELNKAVYEFYSNPSNHFYNPCKDMAIKSFIKYAETRLK